MQEPFENGERFLNMFQLGEESAYENLVTLTDRKVGFSVQRKYPEDIRFKPPKNRKGEDDVVAIIHVVYEHPNETGASFDPNCVPVTVRIGPFSRYRAHHVDYDFEDKESPTEESLKTSKSTPQPIEIKYLDEYCFKHTTGKFINESGEELSGNTLLDSVYEAHCNTVHPIKGLRVRTKIKTRSIAVAGVSSLINLSRALLKHGFGRILDEGSRTSAFLKGYKKDSLKKLSTDSLNIFGYQAARSVIVVFCLLIVVGYLIKNNLGVRWTYASNVFSNNFLALTHSIFILWFFDVIFPKVLLVVMNALIKLRTYLMFHNLRVK